MIGKSAQRYELLDFIRGIAIGLMFAYHFCFGLKQLEKINLDFSNDYFWMVFRGIIVTLFLGLVGISLVLATQTRLNLKSYFKRLFLLFLYMISISWLSYQVLPERYVFFGILHLIFVSSILGLIFVRVYWQNIIVGLMILIVGNVVSLPAFDAPQLIWGGMKTTPVYTNDYAPLFPWFGIVLIGIFLGHLLMLKPKLKRKLDWRANHWVIKVVTLAGQYSLHIYFIHFQMFYILTYFLV
jgi:uncharacterized membrane protein